MSQENKHIDKLTPELIDAYIAGKLSNEQMHQVEMLMLDSQFDAEAMEGIAASGDGKLQEDLLELTSKIDQRVQQENSGLGTTYWLKIAASLLILATASFLIFNLMQPEQTEVLTENEEQVVEPDSQPLSDTLLAMEDSKPEKGSNTLDQPVMSEATELADVEKIYEQTETKVLTEKPVAAQTDHSREEAEPKESASEDLLALSEPEEVEMEVLEEVVMEDAFVVAEEKSINEVRTSQADAALSRKKSARIENRSAGAPAVATLEASEEIAAKPDLSEEELKKLLTASDAQKGKVEMQVIVNHAGEVVSISVLKGANQNLDSLAIKRIRRIQHWIPAQKNGIPVQDTVSLIVDFR